MPDLTPRPTQEQVDACRRAYGEAHDAHLSINGECPWCGEFSEDLARQIGRLREWRRVEKERK